MSTALRTAVAFVVGASTIQASLVAPKGAEKLTVGVIGGMLQGF